MKERIDIQETQKYLDFFQQNFNIKSGCGEPDHAMQQTIYQDDKGFIYLICEVCGRKTPISYATVQMYKQYYEDNKDKEKPYTLDIKKTV
jgi:translation initiation factor 2 beta subunit (eIF-2beta)/eIF-5